MGTRTFSVIIPTSGRWALKRTLRSIRRQDRGDIQVIVVSDGTQPVAEAITAAEARKWTALMYVSGPETRSWGNAQRMEGMRRATGDYLLFIDDDDVYRRGAFRHIRRATRHHPGRILIFRMKQFDTVLWDEPQLEVGKVGSPQMVVPNVADKLGSWMANDRYASDFDFISETVSLQGEPVWDRRVIATIRPLDWRNPRPWLEPRLNWHRWRAKLAIRTRLRRLIRAF
jgi:glycosyltransferase involved in cell wall biosynthesis